MIKIINWQSWKKKEKGEVEDKAYDLYGLVKVKDYLEETIY